MFLPQLIRVRDYEEVSAVLESAMSKESTEKRAQWFCDSRRGRSRIGKEQLFHFLKPRALSSDLGRDVRQIKL